MTVKCVEGEWYVDPATKARFKILGIGDMTLYVVDEFGVQRHVNRPLFERGMQRAPKREPVK